MNKSDLTAVQLEALAAAAAAPDGCFPGQFKFRTWENLRAAGLVIFTSTYQFHGYYTLTGAGRALLAEPDRPKFSAAQKAFIEKWGAKENFTHFYLFDLKGPELKTAEIMADRFKFLTLVKPQIFPKTWYYEWTEAGKSWGKI